MLPDFPDINKFLDKRVAYEIKMGMKTKSPFMSLSRSKRIFEGHRAITILHDGSNQETDFSEISTSLLLDLTNSDLMRPQAIARDLATVANEMERQLTEHFFATMTQYLSDLERVMADNDSGNLEDKIIKALENTQLDFFKDGTPKLPTIFTHPRDHDAWQRAISRALSNPDYKNRFDAIIEQKREEWRGRQGSRKLVG